MRNVFNWPLIIIVYVLKESCAITCRSTNKTGSIFCCDFVLLSVATWLLKFRICAQQWLPGLAIAVVIIDPTGFLGKGKTERYHISLSWLVILCVLCTYWLWLEKTAAAWDSGTSYVYFDPCLQLKLRLWDMLQSLIIVLIANDASALIQLICYVHLT